VRHSIDIVIPVHNAAADLRRCVASVLAHMPDVGSIDARLILIDDASTEAEVVEFWRELAVLGRRDIVLATNELNLGFPLTVNRGMREARPDADIVLLNSDTIVTSGWLDALARCVHSDASIGTATPFSNNAEICSLPEFCVNNPWPMDSDPEPMARALRVSAVPTYPRLPTGVGFCLYVRRELVDRIGPFDPAFGRGYGEECDFCMRAAAAGWHSVLCEDAFVVHTGSRSFGATRSALMERNGALLAERFPDYDLLVREFITADPLRALRELALCELRIRTSALPGVLHVTHDHGGGSAAHVRSLATVLAVDFRHYVLSVSAAVCRIDEHDGNRVLRRFRFVRDEGESWSVFLRAVCARFSIALVHVHNAVEGIVEALAEPDSDIAYGVTVHDLSLACPTVTCLDAEQAYCGGVTEVKACRACLGAQLEFSSVDIAALREKHARLLAGAAFVAAPSRFAADMVRRYYPGTLVDIVPHALPNAEDRVDAIAHALPMADDGRPVVAILGAIGPDKGSRRIERMVTITRQRGFRLRWVLIGYLDRSREPWQAHDGVFTMHGPYDASALPRLLDHYRVDAVAYPSVGPESFSFTLSEAWSAGRPAIVPPIGALAERVAQTGAGWVLDDSQWRSDEALVERIAQLMSPDALAERTAVVAMTRALHLPDAAAMAARMGAHYRRSARAVAFDAPLSTRRCRDALGYAAWPPPATMNPVETFEPEAERSGNGSNARVGTIARFARAALSIRHTAPGRVLYRLAPRTLVDLLKARLPS